MSSILTARNLHKCFNKIVAVKDVSFEVEQGEILGLLGPNGAGKTTTFQMLLGVLTPTSGTIQYFGKDLTSNRAAILERVNFSSTYTNLPWNLKVRDNLAFVSRLYCIPKRKARVCEIISQFNLGPLLEKEIVKLSAGELTRLNLAKAFLNDPEIVLLDEPTASLDPESALFIRDFILERQRSRGLTVLFTSHNMAEVEAVCGRVVFIHRGEVVANDTPKKLALTLDRCSLSFSIENSSEESLKRAAETVGVEISLHKSEVSVALKESQVSPFLTAISELRIPYHNLVVSRATLEDYFLSQTKLPEEQV